MVENEKFWEKAVAKILKTELTKRDITYKQLVEKLESIGVSIKEEDIRGRISRGTFSAKLFVQCLRAMDIKTLQLDEAIFK